MDNSEAPADQRQPTTATHKDQDALQSRWSEVAAELAQLEQLVDEQFQQFDEVLTHCVTLLHQADQLEQMRLELQQEKLAWEQHCETVSSQMTDEYEQLRQAWERLEQEQRQALLSANAPGHEPKAAPIPRPAPAAATSLPGSATPAMHAAATDLDIREVWPPRLNDAAALQFQQMKRQIRTHAAENRKKPEN